MPTASKRFLIVLVDSSIAMMPLPGATIAWAMLSRSSMLMNDSVQTGRGHRNGFAPPQAGRQVKEPPIITTWCQCRRDGAARLAFVARQAARGHDLLLSGRVGGRVERHHVI